MDAYTRLVQCGINPFCAADTIAWFRNQGDDHTLELYIESIEQKHRKGTPTCTA